LVAQLSGLIFAATHKPRIVISLHVYLTKTI
jgi:hypothetical protein